MHSSTARDHGSDPRDLEELQDFFDNAPIGLHWVGPDGTILRANRAELDLLGYDADEYIGRHIAQFHADADVIDDILTRLRRNEVLREYEARMVRKDGAVVDVLIDSSVLWREGEFAHTRCITRDNTARKRAQAALRSSENRYRQIVETANEGVLILDADARATYVNDRFAAMLGYEREHMIGRRVHDLGDDDGREQIEQNLARRRQGIAENFDFRFLHVTGRPVWAIVSATPLTDENGDFAGSLAMVTDITQRRAAEERLVESEARWRLLAESFPAMVSVSNAQGEVEYCNEQFVRYTGLSREELLSGGWVTMLHPEDVKRFGDEWRATLGHGEAYSVEYRARRADGEYRWHMGVVEPVRDASRHIVMWIGAHIDIHDRRLAEDARRRQAELLEQTYDAVLVWDPAGSGIRYWNRAAEELYGYSREEVMGKNNHDLLHTVFPRGLRSFERALRKQGEWRGELEHTTRDGRTIFVESRQVLISTADGEQLVLETARDVTERRHAEQALRESEARFRQLADAMPQIVWAAAPDGTFDYYNRRWYDYTGLPEGVRGDDSWTPVLHPDDVGFTHKIWYDSVRTGEPYQIEYRFKDRISGGYRWHLGRALPIRNQSGAIVRWFGTCTDIDEQKRTEEALRRANAAKDEFLGLVSHELKTPITTIFGNAEVLRTRADQLDPESRDAALEDIGTEADRLHRIVENLLVLARLEQGEMVSAEPILVRRVVSKLVSDHLRRFPHRIIEVDDEPYLVPVLGEPVYVEQVIRNLLSNAEKYSEPDQPIRIGIHARGQELEVSVCDRGVGFDQSEAEKLFTPFYRSPRTANRTPGVGIGLAVCKRLIDVQGGRMWARPRPDGGADIGFALPIETIDSDHG